MFEEPSSSPLILTTSNFPKGGDFMEQDYPARQTAIEMAVSIMEWEGAPLPGVFNPTISQGRILDERQDPTHPLRKGRIKLDAPEIAEVIDEAGQQVIDPVVFKSVSRMDAGE